jgi:DNA-binding protein HU-beta
MTNQELLVRLADDAGITRAQARTVLDTLASVLQKTLKKAGSMRLNGVGTFRVAKRAARKGRNPQTGAAIKIGASKSVRFKATAGLKGSL